MGKGTELDPPNLCTTYEQLSKRTEVCCFVWTRRRTFVRCIFNSIVTKYSRRRNNVPNKDNNCAQTALHPHPVLLTIAYFHPMFMSYTCIYTAEAIKK